MALNEDIKNIANGLLDVYKDYKTDLEISDDRSFYIHDVPQEFTLPALLVRLQTAELVRLNSQEGRWGLVFSVEYAYPMMSEPDRTEKLLDVLGTLLIITLQHPTLKATSFSTQTSEAMARTWGDGGRNQGVEAVSFSVEIFDEPVDITPIT